LRGIQKVVPVERYATAERVFDDLGMTFKLIDSKGFPNHPCLCAVASTKVVYESGPDPGDRRVVAE
jgi:hypothetical protein